MDLLKKAARHYCNGIIRIAYEFIIFLLMTVFFSIAFPYMLGVQISRNEDFFERYDGLGIFTGVLLGGAIWGLLAITAIVGMLSILFGA